MFFDFFEFGFIPVDFFLVGGFFLFRPNEHLGHNPVGRVAGEKAIVDSTEDKLLQREFFNIFQITMRRDVFGVKATGCTAARAFRCAAVGILFVGLHLPRFQRKS